MLELNFLDEAVPRCHWLFPPETVLKNSQGCQRARDHNVAAQMCDAYQQAITPFLVTLIIRNERIVARSRRMARSLSTIRSIERLRSPVFFGVVAINSPCFRFGPPFRIIR